MEGCDGEAPAPFVGGVGGRVGEGVAPEIRAAGERVGVAAEEEEEGEVVMASSCGLLIALSPPPLCVRLLLRGTGKEEDHKSHDLRTTNTY